MGGSWADATPRTGAELLADLQAGWAQYQWEQGQPRPAPQYVVPPAEYEVLRRLRQDTVLVGERVAYARLELLGWRGEGAALAVLEALEGGSPYGRPGAPIRPDHVALQAQRLGLKGPPLALATNRHERRKHAAQARRAR